MALSRILPRVYSEVKSCITYDEYLHAVDEKAGEIVIMNRFVDGDGYPIRNAEKTKEVYQKLIGIKPIIQEPMAVLNVTNNALTDYIAIIMIFIITINLTFYEKSENQLQFLRTTLNGRRKLMSAKIIVMFLSVLFVIICLYGINALISKCLFGTPDFGSPIQSIPFYQKSPFGINTGQFISIYFLVKILNFFLLGIIFMLFGVAFDNIVFPFLASAFIVMTEFAFYTNISATHFLAFFKYINIMYGIKTEEMFADYVNLNLFGIPVNTCFLYWILWLILTAACVFLVMNYSETIHEKKYAFANKLNLYNGFERHTSVFLHEVYKMLFPGRCFIVIVLFCIFIAWWNPAEKIQFDSVDEIYYKDYMDRYYGPLDYNKQKLIKAEKEKFKQLYEDISDAYAQGKSEVFIDAKYKDELDRQHAFEKIEEHAEYLTTVTGGWMFFDKGYSILTNKQNIKNRDVTQAFVYVFMLFAMTFALFGVDYSNLEMRILRTTYYGRGRLKNVKGILGILCTIIAFVLVYIVRMVNILNAYGNKGMNASAASMEHLAQIPQNISVFQYILIILLMRFIGGLIIVKVISVIFKCFKNSIFALVLCITVFIMPLVLMALELPNAQYILLNPLLLGNVL